MQINNLFILFLMALTMSACSNDGDQQVQQNPVESAQQASAPEASTTIDAPVNPANIPAGVYSVDKMHTYLTFSYLHLGYSYPLLRVTGIDGELNLDGNSMQNSSVSMAIDASTIDTTLPRFNDELKSLQYFNVNKYPYITYTTHSYEPITETTGKLTGFLTIKGKTRPVILDVTINNAIMHPMLKKPVIGFSATGSLKRSEFGIARNIPFVADKVTVDISIEFLQGRNETSTSAANIARETTAAAPAESLVIAPTIAPSDSDIPGTYTITTQTRSGERIATLTIDNDGTGTLSESEDSNDISDIKYDGNAFSFSLTTTSPRGEVEREYLGTVDGDNIVGTTQTVTGDQPFSGIRL